MVALNSSLNPVWVDFEGLHVLEATRPIRPGKARKPRIPRGPSVLPVLGFNSTLTPPSLSSASRRRRRGRPEVRRAPHRHPELHPLGRGEAQNDPWDRVKELPLLLHSGKNRREGDAKLTEQLCKTFGVDQIKGDNTDRALKAYDFRAASRRARAARRSSCRSSPRFW